MPDMDTFLSAEFPGDSRASLQPTTYEDASLYGPPMPDMDTFLSAEFPGDSTARLQPTTGHPTYEDASLYGPPMPDMDTFLSAEFPGDSTASLQPTTGHPDSMANKGPDSSVILSSRSSDGQALADACSISGQDTGLGGEYALPDQNESFPTNKEHEILHIGDFGDSTSTPQSRMLAVAHLLKEIAS
jgi:hypothetical protein